MWTGENAENEGFRKRWRHELDNQSPTENENVYRFIIASVDGRKQLENASVYAHKLQHYDSWVLPKATFSEAKACTRGWKQWQLINVYLSKIVSNATENVYK